MGLFSHSKKNKPKEGQWLKSYRQSNWVKTSQISDRETYISTDSCYQDSDEATYFILKSYDSEVDAHIYFGCIILPMDDHLIWVVVERAEGEDDQDVIKKDDWSKERVFDANRESYIQAIINQSKKIAVFNNFNYPPGYIIDLTYMLN